MRTAVAFAVAFSVFLSACAPSNNDECLSDAANKPTAQGVFLAKQLCHDRFVQPEVDRRKLERERAIAAKLDEWQKTAPTAQMLSDVVTEMGNPDHSIGPGACSPGKQAPDACMTYLWNYGENLYFRMETTMNGVAYVHWLDPTMAKDLPGF